jgi:dTMP kinase
MTRKRCFQAPPPGVDLDRLTGLLVVLEGPDSAGRSTQLDNLSEWLENKGYAVEQVGIKRSILVSEELAKAQEGNVLSPRTMSLFYATDFYDQLENRIVTALRAGFVVLADRYIFTLMARAIVRGEDPDWVESLYSRAIVPDAVFYLSVSTNALAERTLAKYGSLDYWESGMDIGLSRDWYDSFLRYQRRMRIELKGMMERHGGVSVNANRSINAVQMDLRARLEQVLEDGVG